MKRLRKEWKFSNKCIIEVDEDMIRTYARNYDIDSLLKFQTIPEDVLRKLTEDFDVVHWALVVKHQILSDSFIEDYSDDFCWSSLSYFQVITVDLVNLFPDKIDWREISYSKYIQDDVVDSFPEKISWGLLSDIGYVSERILENHTDRLYLKPIMHNSDNSKVVREKARSILEMTRMF